MAGGRECRASWDVGKTVRWILDQMLPLLQDGPEEPELDRVQDSRHWAGAGEGGRFHPLNDDLCHQSHCSPQEVGTVEVHDFYFTCGHQNLLNNIFFKT